MFLEEKWLQNKMWVEDGAGLHTVGPPVSLYGSDDEHSSALVRTHIKAAEDSTFKTDSASNLNPS